MNLTQIPRNFCNIQKNIPPNSLKSTRNSWENLSRCNQNLRKGSQENIICCHHHHHRFHYQRGGLFSRFAIRGLCTGRRQEDRQTDGTDQTRPGPNRPTNPPKPPHERTDTVLASTRRNCDSAPEGHVVFARKLAFCAPVASSVCLLEKAKSARHLEGTNPPASRATPLPSTWVRAGEITRRSLREITGPVLVCDCVAA